MGRRKWSDAHKSLRVNYNDSMEWPPLTQNNRRQISAHDHCPAEWSLVIVDWESDIWREFGGKPQGLGVQLYITSD